MALSINFQKHFVLMTVVLSLSIAVLTYLALGIPHWISWTQDSTSIGLYQFCHQGDGCQDINWKAVATSAAASSGNSSSVCHRDGNDVKDRMQTVAGVMLACAVVMLFETICFVVMNLEWGKGKITKKGKLWLLFGQVACAVLSLMVLCLFGFTVNNWLFCDKSFCDVISNGQDCGFGFSFSCPFITLIGLSIAAGLYAWHLFWGGLSAVDVPFWGIFISGGACALFILGMAVPSWITVYPHRSSFGLLGECESPTDCGGVDFDNMARLVFLHDNSCVRDPDDIRSRFYSSAVLLLIFSIAMLIIGIMYFMIMCKWWKPVCTHSKKLMVVVLLGISFVGYFVGFIVMMQTTSSWLVCGESFCDMVESMLGTDVSCTYSFSFVLLMIAAGGNGLLFFLHLCELNKWFCFDMGGPAEEEGENAPFGETVAPPTQGDAPEGAAEPPARVTMITTDDGKQVPLPAGKWEFDAVSGYYWNEQRYLFWDPNSVMFYEPIKDKWFKEGEELQSAEPEKPPQPQPLEPPAAAAAAAPNQPKEEGK